MSPRQVLLVLTILASAFPASCAPRSAPWKSYAPESHDLGHIASELKQAARPPLIGLPIPDTLAVQCLRSGAVRMVLDWGAQVPQTNNPEHEWQPPPVREMPFRIDWGPTQTLAFNREIFEHWSGAGRLSYRYVADERSEPRLLKTLDAMSHGRSLRRFDVIRKPKYSLGPEIGEFVAACRRSARA